jgi:TRAP-type mannitol/chloroaromatic compound transport system permease small subunit
VDALITVTKVLDRVNLYLGRYFASWFLVLLMALAVFEVVTRRFLGIPQIWTFEVFAYLFCAQFVLALGYTLHYKEHVNVDALTLRFSERVQVLLETVVYVVFIGTFLWLMIPSAIEYAARSWEARETAPTAFSSPVYPAKTLIPISLFLLLIQLVAILLKNGIFLVRGDRIE